MAADCVLAIAAVLTTSVGWECALPPCCCFGCGGLVARFSFGRVTCNSTFTPALPPTSAPPLLKESAAIGAGSAEEKVSAEEVKSEVVVSAATIQQMIEATQERMGGKTHL